MDASSAEQRLDSGQILLGRRIRQLRQDIGLELTPFAERAGLTKSYISNVERGERLPSLPALLSIAEALHTTVAGLLDEVYPFGRKRRPRVLPTPPPDGRKR